MKTISFPRTPATPIQPSGTFRFGAAEIEFTPRLGYAMAGYSTDGFKATGVRAPLMARILLLEDADGERLAIIVLDLMSSSRYLCERLATLTGNFGLDRRRLFVMGTHTHSAPGHFYGNSLYDRLAQKQPGFDEHLANTIAEQVAIGVAEAVDALEPATLGFSRGRLWGWSRQASTDAFARNPEAEHWLDADHPGCDCPADLATRPERRAVDPRVDALTATASDGRILGVLGVFACHPTTEGPGCKDYSPDWPGHAAAHLAQCLTDAHRPVVAISVGACGDINGLHDAVDPGPRLAATQGQAVAEALLEVVRNPTAIPADESLEVGVTAWNWREDAVVDGDEDSRLASEWCFGVATLGGGEEGRNWLHRWGLVREGGTSTYFEEGHPQYPKPRAFGPLHQMIQRWFQLQPSPELSVQTVRLGPLVLIGLPGEPTVTVAHRIETAALAATGARWARCFGYVGDYISYVTSAQEYDAQCYEGASTIFGRNTAAHLQLRALETLTGPSAALTEPVVFQVIPAPK